MLNPNPYMMLSGAFGFSAADLNANRLGQMTSNQRQQLFSQRSHALVLPVALLMMLLVVSYVLHIELFVVVFLVTCLVSIMLATWQCFDDDLDGHVQAIAGVWTIRKRPFRRTIVMVNGQTFNPLKPTNTLINDSAHYRLYYTPGTHTILSVEII